MSRLVLIPEDELELILDRVLCRRLTQSTHTPILETLEYLDLAEAAKFLRMSESSLYTHTSQRRVPFIKRGRRLHFKKSDLLAWLDAGRKKTRDEIAEEAGISGKGGKRL